MVKKTKNIKKKQRKSHPPANISKETKANIQARFTKLMEEIQSSRTHFRNVVERNVDGVIVVGEDGAVRYVNPAAESLFGAKREEIVGRSFGLPVDSDRAVEVDFTTPTGDPGTGEMRVVSTDWEGEPANLITVRDITERKRAEIEIRELNEALEARVARRTAQLEAVNRELEAFNYAVSHDLRAPLARIDGYASLLLDELKDAIDEEHLGYIGRIRAGVKNMVELTDGLLQLSRLTQRTLEVQEVNLSAAAGQILDMIQSREPDRRVQWTVAPGLIAKGDLVLLRAVLENLISNAWKYSGKEDVSMIEVGRTMARGATAFFVKDNGAGFDMSEADKLFHAFTRLHDSTQFPGVGVGLTTVQRIIHRHGGRIWAESKPDQGATFYFTLSS